MLRRNDAGINAFLAMEMTELLENKTIGFRSDKHGRSDPSLADILGNPRLLALTPVASIPAILTQLAALQSQLVTHLLRVEQRGATQQSFEAKDYPENRLLTVAAAAERLSFTKAYLYDLIRKEQLPVIRQGRHIRISTVDLDDWVSSHRQNAFDSSFSRRHSRRNKKQKKPGTGRTGH